MYLSDPIVTIIYDSGRAYVASIEAQTDKIRLFEEFEPDEEEITAGKQEYEYDCFTAFDGVTEDGDFRTIEELVEKCDSIITSYKKEPDDSMIRHIEHGTTEYPPR